MLWGEREQRQLHVLCRELRLPGSPLQTWGHPSLPTLGGHHSLLFPSSPRDLLPPFPKRHKGRGMVENVHHGPSLLLILLSSSAALSNHMLGPQYVQTPISSSIQTCQESIRLYLELGRREWSCLVLRFQNNSQSAFAETSWNFSAERDESTPG